MAADGAITVSGSYQCSADHVGTVLVGGTVEQADLHAAIGGSVATCDGRPHTWRTTGQPYGAFLPGPARGDATLVELHAGESLIPVLPNILAHDTRDVTIVPV